MTKRAIGMVEKEETEFNTALSIDFETAPQILTERLSFQN